MISNTAHITYMNEQEIKPSLIIVEDDPNYKICSVSTL
ncbi:hypothetical protein D052_1741 [Vibrio parahaemolyticus 10290]|nr:hypothetical protein D052_1741 [Vibrio parahaemolyticus 10290]